MEIKLIKSYFIDRFHLLFFHLDARILRLLVLNCFVFIVIDSVEDLGHVEPENVLLVVQVQDFIAIS